MATQDTFPIITSIAQQALCVTDEEVDELQAYFSRREAIGPILNPTGYRNDMTMAEKCEEVFTAFAAFRAVVKKIWNKELAEIGSAEEVKP